MILGDSILGNIVLGGTLLSEESESTVSGIVPNLIVSIDTELFEAAIDEDNFLASIDV